MVRKPYEEKRLTIWALTLMVISQSVGLESLTKQPTDDANPKDLDRLQIAEKYYKYCLKESNRLVRGRKVPQIIRDKKEYYWKLLTK
jgi:hypothetical protein